MTPEQKALQITDAWPNLCNECDMDDLNNSIAKAIREARAEGMRERDDLLREIKRHCVCTRNVIGFDYGEKHPILGKPATGKRWLVPADMIDAHFKKMEAGESNGA